VIFPGSTRPDGASAQCRRPLAVGQGRVPASRHGLPCLRHARRRRRRGLRGPCTFLLRTGAAPRRSRVGPAPSAFPHSLDRVVGPCSFGLFRALLWPSPRGRFRLAQPRVIDGYHTAAVLGTVGVSPIPSSFHDDRRTLFAPGSSPCRRESGYCEPACLTAWPACSGSISLYLRPSLAVAALLDWTGPARLPPGCPQRPRGPTPPPGTCGGRFINTTPRSFECGAPGRPPTIDSYLTPSGCLSYPFPLASLSSRRLSFVPRHAPIARPSTYRTHRRAPQR